MNDQEFEAQLDELMTQDSPKGKKKKNKKRRRIIIAVVVVVVLLLVVKGVFGGNKEVGMPVYTQPLTKGDVQEVLSLSGPISGTDSAEVVSNLHAEILEILVKEGDRVTSGQVLARVDQTDVQKEVDIAQNAYDLAIANRDEAQIEAENGYAKAVQELRAAQTDSQRKEVLYASGDIAQTEIETARNTLNDAKRALAEYNVVDGRAMANRSFDLQIKNAEFELEQKKKKLTETEVTSPIAGTVVRVNSRVGRFADIVDDDKPLFVIDNLENLEMKINVSEYSIGKVKVGQEAKIRADILNGQTEDGIITSISPTGEEKGGGSTERVIPTTIQILNKDTGLIAGITAKAEIVLSESIATWVVPISAVVERDDGSFLAAVENGIVKMIPVTTGVENDIQIEVLGDDLTAELVYIIAPDAGMTDGMPVMVMQ